MYFMSMACVRHEVMDVKELTPCSVPYLSGKKTTDYNFFANKIKIVLVLLQGRKVTTRVQSKPHTLEDIK